MNDHLLPDAGRLPRAWTAAAAGLTSAAGVMIASALPWTHVHGLWATQTIYGTDGAGRLSLIAGTVVMLLLLYTMLIAVLGTTVNLDPRPALRALFGLAFVLGLLCLVIFVFDGIQVIRAVANFHDTLGRASVGAGVYLGAISSLALCETTGRISHRLRMRRAA